MSENKPVRFGILGCANIARKVSRAIRISPNATLQAIGSRSIDKASKFASENGFPDSANIYGSYEAVLDDPEVDAVYVPLPTSLHLKWAVLAAEKKKHLLLEKPVALNVSELDKILEACESNGVQYMDATMWMHHPRTAKMKEFLADPERFGKLKSVHSIFSYDAGPDFLKNDIRVKPDLDALGSLGDTGWYCTRAILWAADYELPKTVTALREPEFNGAGVIMSCGASLSWGDGKIATFYCSFLTNLTMDITCGGTKGNLRIHDFVIPFQENVGQFYAASKSKFAELALGCEPIPSEHVVMTDLPQEALMVSEFARLAANIERNGLKPEKKWPTISRKTQLVLDAVKASIEKGFEPVEIHSCFTYEADHNFLQNNIRVKPDLDSLGALGDIGWYCIQAILWAANYELPETVTAWRDPELNEAGVILSCGACLNWKDGKVATFYCSFLTNLTMDLSALGTKGNLHIHDFAIPFQENVASYHAGSQFRMPMMSEHAVANDLPQEALMVSEFAGLVKRRNGDGLEPPEMWWPGISRKTQQVLDMVKASIERGFQPVEILG